MSNSYFELDDLDDLLEDGGPVVVNRDALTWTVEFTAGDYNGYKLTLTGLEFPAESTELLPPTGTITGLAWALGETPIFEVTDIQLAASRDGRADFTLQVNTSVSKLYSFDFDL